MNPRKQLGSEVLKGICSLEEAVTMIEKQLVPYLIQQSDVLQQVQSSQELSRMIVFDSKDAKDGARFAVWSIDAALHRVIIRTVLMEHILSTTAVGQIGTRDLPNLVRNLQTMIVKMQVHSFDMHVLDEMHMFDFVHVLKTGSNLRASQHHLHSATCFLGR